jgi:RsiW-degrading membrane proteinase PrsW (M82 family)
MATTPAVRTWCVTLLVVLAAGPWGVLGALFNNTGSGAWGLITVIVLAPVIEEIMKIALALWVIEKRPYLFRMPAQILLCALAGGLAFALIENLMYFLFQQPNGPQIPGIEHPSTAAANWFVWRWTVCTGLHATCSFFSGLGLVRMWSRAIAQRARPDIAYAAPMIIAAMICHGLYNGLVTVAELSGWLKF